MKRSRKLTLAMATLVGILTTGQAFAFFGFFDNDDDDYWRRYGPYGWGGPYGYGGPYGWGGPYGYGRPYGWGGGPYGWGSPYGWGYPGYTTQSNESEAPPPPPLPE
jgi:hypothetical protein